MVFLGPLLREVFKQGTKQLVRYYALEGKAFNRLYTGFPRSRTIGRGVRHGLAVGSVAGSFINQAPDTPGNGIQAPFRKRTKTGTSYKTRNRFSGRRRGRNSDRCYPNRYKRRANYKRYNRM